MNLPSPAAGRHRERFYRLASDHAASLAPPDAIRWITTHGLLALAGRGELSAEVEAGLLALRRQNLAANLYRVRQFQQMVDALGEIPVCPLKGIELLGTVYRDDPESRVMVDIDLLVPEGEASEVVGRLTRRLDLTEPASSAARRHFWHDRYLHGPELVVEVHTRLGIKHGWSTGWDDLTPRPGRLHDRGVHRLDPATGLLHLLIHFVKHGPFLRLGWVEDILRQVEEGADAAEMLALARRLGAGRTVIAGARVLRRLVGDDFLEEIPSSSGGPGQALLVANERWLWRPAVEHPPTGGAASAKMTRNLTALLLADRPLDALRFVGAKGRELWLRRRFPDLSPDG